MNPALRRSGKSILILLFLAASLVRSAQSTDGARVVKYGKEDVVIVHAKLRFSTLLVLPENEEILDFTTGDKEFWIVNGAHNLCYVHPAATGIKSNLNLITASGHVYSFLLTEISNEPGTEVDLKLFLESKEGPGPSVSTLKGYVRAAELEAYRKEMATTKSLADDRVQIAEGNAIAEESRFRQEYPARLRFDYRIDTKAAREPFRVTAVYHDDRFTYVVCAAREKPALYEVKDGKPNLLSFQVEGGVYIVPKILDAAYLAVGKKKAGFQRVAQ